MNCRIEYKDSKFNVVMEQTLGKLFGGRSTTMMFMFNEMIEKFPDAYISKVTYGKLNDTIYIYLSNRMELMEEILLKYPNYKLNIDEDRDDKE